jgi:peptidoglycan/xylan/chitin deacetylase (PgdA/CDA1 family)
MSSGNGHGDAKGRLARALHRLGLADLLLRSRRGSPLILRYHRVYPDGARPFYRLGVERSLFEAQLDFLASRFRVVPLAAIVESLRESRALEGAVAITFDDGYRDNLTEAAPALRERGLPATLFVTVGEVIAGRPMWWDRLAAAVQAAPAGASTAGRGTDGPPLVLDGDQSRARAFRQLREAWKRLPWNEVRNHLERAEGDWGGAPADALVSPGEVEQMARDGWEIGSHTLDHPILSRLETREIERQIIDSRRRLEEMIGGPVRYFSYPNGKRDDVTPVVQQTVWRAGYQAAVATIEGRVTPRSNLFMLERKGATEGMSADGRGRFDEALFSLELTGFYDALFQRRRRDRGIC